MSEATTRGASGQRVADFRYDTVKRKNIPPAGLAAQGRIAEHRPERYAYNPHLPPVLRFDATGSADRLFELVEKAQREPLTEDEARLLAEALRHHEPWLEWSGKRERKWFEVDPVALHIHERVAAKAILAVAARQDVQRSLFADPQQTYREAVQFYQHDVDWANRLILGDSLQAMSSLAKREGLAGKVQMIYMDPPYGIKYASNFQPQIGQESVADRPNNLTRDPEVVKAYRDTWRLGIHSYLSYLRDRLIVARELLHESGSIFVQIGDENVHWVRALLEEVFGAENFCSLITFTKTGGQTDDLLAGVADFILWFCRDKSKIKYRRLYRARMAGGDGGDKYNQIELPNGERLPVAEATAKFGTLPETGKIFRKDTLTSQKPPGSFPVRFEGEDFYPTPNYWKTSPTGMQRLVASVRVVREGKRLAYVRYHRDFPVYVINNVWADVGGVQSRSDPKVYAVQTAATVIQRCLLMTTDPGDLVLDPTCGSGTTAYVAEQWGRRRIAIDTSRVAITIARQRLLTATFEHYTLRGEGNDPSTGFIYKTVPHITLKSIAQNAALDPVFAKHAPILAAKLAALNAALAEVTPELRARLQAKLVHKERTEGKRAVTDADRRRWLLPKDGWQEWEVPFDSDPDWPPALQETLAAYRAAWRAKMDEVNAVIAASAEHEELVDQPEVVKGVVRVSGPFTVEAVIPPEERLDLDLMGAERHPRLKPGAKENEAPPGLKDPASLNSQERAAMTAGIQPEASPVDELDEELETFEEVDLSAAKNAEAYLDKMIRLLRSDGVRFFDNKQVRFLRLDPVHEGVLHAEGEWAIDGGEPRSVAVTFGPQYGDLTVLQVEEALPLASRRGYDDLIFAAFSFDAAAQAVIQEDPNPRVRAHLVQIRPDINPGMDGLLKQTPNSQLFTVMGMPRTALKRLSDGQWQVTMEGVDIYDPVENAVYSTGAEKVAAWFLDSDYDGRTFCICQAFFPDRSAWDKLARALKGVIDEEAFAAFSGTTSLPFPAGPHRKVAVKVIDPRGNEVMRVHALSEETRYGIP